MGAAISKFIEGIENQDEKKKTANDALNALKLLCDVKAKAFFDEIVSDTASAGAKLLPVDKVTAKDHQTYCNFSKDAQKTGDEINNAIGSFVKGEIVSVASVLCYPPNLWPCSYKVSPRQSAPLSISS